MSEKPIRPLRQRMIEDMTVRNFVEKTRNDYIRHVRTFTAFLGRSPDAATAEDLRRFQLHQAQSGVRPPSINGAVAALRFFFTVTLDRPEMGRHLTFVREPRKIPVVLSPEEVARLLEAAPGAKYKAAFSAAYSAGLRVSEVVALKVSAHRFRAPTATHRAGQRPQGSLCHALPKAARTPARLVSHRSPEGLAASLAVIPCCRSRRGSLIARFMSPRRSPGSTSG